MSEGTRCLRKRKIKERSQRGRADEKEKGEECGVGDRGERTDRTT